MSRVKCKLCETVLDIPREGEWLSCKCGEVYIGIKWGRKIALVEKSNDNIVEVDDDENEIVIDQSLHAITSAKTITRNERIKMLRNMVEGIERLPSTAMLNPINHYDYCSSLMLLLSIFESESEKVAD